MGTEEGKDIHAKGIGKILNTIIAGIFTNLNKEMPLQVQESLGHQVDMNKTEPPPQYITVKIISTEHKYRMLKDVQEDNQIIHNGKHIKIIVGFSPETLKARRVCHELF
jgi:hypothetical protein